MKRRTDCYYDLIKSIPTEELPESYTYYLDKSKSVLTLKLNEKGLTNNMQSNESAFESWAIVLKLHNPKIKKIIIDWDDLPDNKQNNLHFNRFVYRLSKFVQTYDWAQANKPIPLIPSILTCNYPNGKAAEAIEHQKDSEGWIECKYVEKHKSEYDVMNHQLPIGIFKDKVGRESHYTTGQKSAIDIWAIKDKSLFIFELKKPGNNVLGIISELMFYTNILQDIMSHRIQYQEDNKLLKAVKNNFRDFGKLYDVYKNGRIQEINAVLLADTLHPLITSELIELVNNSGRLKYCRISYTKQKTNI